MDSLFHLYSEQLDAIQSVDRLRSCQVHSLHSPELVTRSQFKLLMTDKFKVRDPKLLDNIFMLADVEARGALDIREICAVLLFHLRGSVEIKLSLFFRMMRNRTILELHEGGFINKFNIIKVIEDALVFLK